jgi:hypothetical protein
MAKWIRCWIAGALMCLPMMATSSGILYSLGAQPAPNLQACASEGEMCRFSGTATVTYGAGKSWRSEKFTNGARCTNQAFGGDPAPNQKKTCFTSMPWQVCAGEGGTCRFSGGSTVAYGAGNRWKKLNFQNGAACNNQTFGGDPAPGVKKTCYVEATATSSVPNRIDARWTRCANEGGNCRVGGVRSVAYGAQGKWVYLRVNGSVACNNSSFRQDPAPGLPKSCFAEP